MYHEALYRVLLRYPGITVLHDHGLHHFMATRTVSQGDFAGYVREMGYALGTAGVDLAYRIRQGEAEHPLYTVPLNERVLDHSLGVIVHSHYVERAIRAVRPSLPVAVIPAPICTETGVAAVAPGVGLSRRCARLCQRRAGDLDQTGHSGVGSLRPVAR